MNHLEKVSYECSNSQNMFLRHVFRFLSDRQKEHIENNLDLNPEMLPQTKEKRQLHVIP